VRSLTATLWLIAVVLAAFVGTLALVAHLFGF
jgi:hypothetical protein